MPYVVTYVLASTLTLCDLDTFNFLMIRPIDLKVVFLESEEHFVLFW